MTKYIATHGVHFADLGVAFRFDRAATDGASYDPVRGTSRVYVAELSGAQEKALVALPRPVLVEYGIKPAPADRVEA